MNNEKPLSHIFLSYHSSKVELVQHLSNYLEKNAITTWYAAKSIRSGEQWDEAIHCAIKSCKAVVLLFCAQADASIQVKRELSLADKYKKPVFWLRVERVEPNNLSYFLTSTQWLDWLDTRDATLEKLIKDINAIDSENFQAPTENKIDITTSDSANPAPIDWTKGIFAFATDKEAAECAARVYFHVANRYPDSSVILPTGRSATLLFRAMVRIADEYDGCPFGDAHIMSDTETFGVWSGHETSRTGHIIEMLMNPLKRRNQAPDESHLNLLSGIYTEDDPVKKAQKTLRMYPPSVHGVSVSPVGEILAYEVATFNDADEIIYDSPRIVEVNEHSKKYIDPNQPSKSILTIGLGTALSCNVLLILAFDIQKARIIRHTLTAPMTAGIPATLLRNHPNAYIITTESLAHEANIDHLVKKEKDVKEAAKWIASN